MHQRADAHNAELAEKVAKIVHYASRQMLADKGKSYIVLDVWPPYDAGDGEQWANNCVAQINALDPRKVTAEVLRAEMHTPKAIQ